MENQSLRLSDSAVTLRKMRLLKGLTRKQAGIIFHLSHKTFEKLENGRGKIDEKRLASFAEGYMLINHNNQLIQDNLSINTVKEEISPVPVNQTEVTFTHNTSITQRFSFDSDQSLNSIINNKIVCHEFVTEQNLNEFLISTRGKIKQPYLDGLKNDVTDFLNSDC